MLPKRTASEMMGGSRKAEDGLLKRMKEMLKENAGKVTFSNKETREFKDLIRYNSADIAGHKWDIKMWKQRIEAAQKAIRELEQTNKEYREDIEKNRQEILELKQEEEILNPNPSFSSLSAIKMSLKRTALEMVRETELDDPFQKVSKVNLFLSYSNRFDAITDTALLLAAQDRGEDFLKALLKSGKVELEEVIKEALDESEPSSKKKMKMESKETAGDF
ncbi:hypothetical protein BCON_0418g00050 [Botryotinia convoluta]|uniref:Uncharacterized protein n=1 Tax=Botryotinia convoluta TaxID=54673 RepID=A0A4Z1HCI9_9HELO|nr:hypothetical protein BCON_0418g00050 [Botryotinia convoluta]